MDWSKRGRRGSRGSGYGPLPRCAGKVKMGKWAARNERNERSLEGIIQARGETVDEQTEGFITSGGKFLSWVGPVHPYQWERRQLRYWGVGRLDCGGGKWELSLCE